MTAQVPIFKSYAEKLTARVLDQLNIMWKYESTTFVLPSGEVYIPDFELGELGIFIETKSGIEAARLHKPTELNSFFHEFSLNEQNDDYYDESLNVVIMWDGVLFGFAGNCGGSWFGVDRYQFLRLDHSMWCPNMSWQQCHACDKWQPCHECIGWWCRSCGYRGKLFKDSQFSHHLWQQIKQQDATIRVQKRTQDLVARWRNSLREPFRL